MSKSFIKAALLGGLVVFVWGMLSWMGIPLHKHCFNQFTSESKVAAVIRENAPRPGIYLLPNTMHYDENTSQKELQRSTDLMDKGPFMFASIVPSGLGGKMSRSMVFCLMLQIVGAFIATWLLSRTRKSSFWNRVLFVTVFGCAVGLLGLAPFWIWWGFPGFYIALHLFDIIIGWFLAGMVIAKVAKAS